jgi:hypothetical protein
MAQGRDAGFADANHFLYLCKANQLAAVDPAKIKAPTLVLYAPNDLVFYEPIVRETMQKIATAKQGKTVHPPDNVTRSHTRRLAFHSGPASYLQRQQKWLTQFEGPGYGTLSFGDQLHSLRQYCLDNNIT